MAYLVVIKFGVPILSLEGGDVSTGVSHLMMGYPALYQDYLDGYVTFVGSETEPELGPFGYVASMQAEVDRFAVFTTEGIVKQLYNLENRLRTLESAGRVSFSTFRRKFLLLAGGSLNVRGTKSASGAVLLPGGGGIAVLGWKEAFGTVSLTGGGSITCTGSAS